jgi:ribosomal protein L21E
MVGRFAEGDRVRVDIPDATDPDHERYHGRHGTVTAVIEDDAPAETGGERDALIYRVEFDDGTASDFRWRDLRPPIDG